MNGSGRDPRELLRAPRRTDLPFPPSRYLPGAGTHPSRDPGFLAWRERLGTAEAEEPVVEAGWRGYRDYLLGLDLYNHGFWWEAHEVWEDLWVRAARGSPAHAFLQGLIQCAASHLKLQAGQAQAAADLAQAGAARIRGAAAAEGRSRCWGLDVEAFLAALDAYQRRGAAGHDPGAFPYLLPGEPA